MEYIAVFGLGNFGVAVVRIFFRLKGGGIQKIGKGVENSAFWLFNF
jgi:hypothetical protein